MKSKVRAEMQRLAKTLSGKSWTTYRQIVGRLTQGSTNPIVKLIHGALRNHDVDEMIRLADVLVSQKYETASEHFEAHQVSSLIKKYPFPREMTRQDPLAKAKETFLQAEQKCLQMNERLSDISYTVGFESVLHNMRQFIAYVIGHEPDLKKIYERCDFGPGASIGVSGNATNIARKVESNWSVTPSALPFAFSSISNDWSFLQIISGRESSICLDWDELRKKFHNRCEIVGYNKISFVPKTVITHRAIAVEPLWNGFVQKGIDSVLRDFLKRIGINLSDQTRNQRWARYGSESDHEDSFVTIDLSAASDSISRMLCKLLLPYEWYRLLDATRSKSFLLDGVVRPYEKFCSMGNGFCFPLETLIFAAACHAIGAGSPGVDYSVFGDDIIVRKKHAARLIEILELIGFQTNTKKTFIEGPFRESCGADWFEGEDVRPFVFDFRLDSLESLFKFLNLVQRSRRCKDYFYDILPVIRRLIPAALDFRRPLSGPDDSAYTVDLDDFMTSPFARWDVNQQCWSWKELIHRSVSDKLPPNKDREYSLTIAALRGASSSHPFTLRRSSRTAVRRFSSGSGFYDKEAEGAKGYS